MNRALTRKKDDDSDLGRLLETFVNKVSHPRGRALAFMSEASVTVAQVILMNAAMTERDSTPSSIAATVNLSLSSVSQMIERLVKLGFLQRSEDAEDRRRKTIRATPKAKGFLDNLRTLRAEEFAAGAAVFSRETRDVLKSAIARALRELEHRPPSSKDKGKGDAQPSRKAEAHRRIRAQR